MSYSDYKKVFKQLAAKKVKLAKYIKHNTPGTRTCGRTTRKCRRCGRPGAHIRKYGLGFCRTCFRDIATVLGFKKYH